MNLATSYVELGEYLIVLKIFAAVKISISTRVWDCNSGKSTS